MVTEKKDKRKIIKGGFTFWIVENLNGIRLKYWFHVMDMIKMVIIPVLFFNLIVTIFIFLDETNIFFDQIPFKLT